MSDKTRGGTTRLPQAALDRIDKIVAELPPLTDAQRRDLSAIIYGARSTSAAA
jgi:hypothetical protein